MERVIVLGGAGYIGSHMVYELIRNNYYVVVVDNLSTGFKRAVHKDAKFYEGDILDENFLDYVFKKEKIDFVIDFAAFSQVGESMQKPLKYYKNNLCGTCVLLEVMLKNNVKNIVFSSTAAVYGDVKTTPIKETQKTSPTNCYGATKLAVENMLKWTSLAHNLKFVCLRYFNACGADKTGTIGEAHNPETHLIPIVLEVALKKREHVKIFGTDYNTKDKTAIRDYVHVTDLAKAHILAMKYLKNGGQSDCFNLGCGAGFSVKDVILTAEYVTGCKIKTVEEPRRLGDVEILTADFEKARKILNWEPKITNLKDIIASAFNWHKNNL